VVVLGVEEEQRRAPEAAAKAETDLKDVLTSLQVGLGKWVVV
jgi:hypothetical protein